jgi:hypothetical protein
VVGAGGDLEEEGEALGRLEAGLDAHGEAVHGEARGLAARGAALRADVPLGEGGEGDLAQREEGGAEGERELADGIV